MAFYWLKFIGTTSKLNDYDDMIAATTLDVNRWELELAIQAIDKGFPVEGEGTKSLAGSLSNPRKIRREYTVTFEPFSNHLAIAADVPQNSDTWEIFMRDIWPYQIWITRPSTEGREAPPRWQNSELFPITYALLPARCEPEPADLTLVNDGGVTETAMAFKAKRRA